MGDNDFAAFRGLVHEAYPHLHDRAALETHPLGDWLRGASPAGAERLHRVLVDAIEWIRPLGSVAPSAVEWRRCRLLQLRYLEGATPEEIAQTLRISPARLAAITSTRLDRKS